MLARIGHRLKSAFSELARFPVPVVLVLLLGAYDNLHIIWGGDFSDDYFIRTYFALWAGIFAGLAGHLYALGRQWRFVSSLVCGAVGGAVGIGLLFCISITFLQIFVLLSALIMLVMAAAYLRPAAGASAFWQFSFRLFVALCMAMLTAFIFYLGFSGLVKSISYLFDINEPTGIFDHLASIAFDVVGPLVFLALLPRDLDGGYAVGEAPGLAEKAASALVNYALVPLLLAYVLVLHAYAIRILVRWTLPLGEIGDLVLVFGIIGTVTYLIAYPWRDHGSLAVRWFVRLWFIMLIVPVVMLFIAVEQRIAEYGITPARYWLCLFAFWLSGIIVYMAIRRRQVDLRIIPASLGLLLVLTSVGPWGVTALSVRSQTARFTRLLTDNGVLVDGHFVKPLDGKTEKSVHEQADSILSTLDELDSLDKLRPIFSQSKDDLFLDKKGTALNVSGVRTVLGIDTDSTEVRSLSDVVFKANPVLSVNVEAKSRIVGPLHIDALRDDLKEKGAGNSELPAALNGLHLIAGDADLRVSDGQGEIGYVDFAPTLQLLAANKTMPDKVTALEPIHVSSPAGRVTVVIQSAYAKMDAKPRIDSMEFWLIVKEAD